MSSMNREFYFHLSKIDQLINLPYCTGWNLQFSSMIMNRSGESGNPCLVPYIRGEVVGFLSLNVMLDIECFETLYQVEEVLF